MIREFALILMTVSTLFLFFVISRYLYKKYQFSKRLNLMFNIHEEEIFKKNQNKQKEKLQAKLTRAGLTQQQFYEIIGASIVAGLALVSLIFILNLSLAVQIGIIFIALCIAIFMPFIYLAEQITARIKRIDNDLAIALDLIIIILEGGGGLNNAIDKVTKEAVNVLGKDLLQEFERFKYELVSYGSNVAYANLASRTGSEAIGSIVGFMKLSEETGIGVKTVFENQTQSIKEQEILSVEKKAATMNISITLVMFIFIIPAVIAMIAFPMAADALMPGFK